MVRRFASVPLAICAFLVLGAGPAAAQRALLKQWFPWLRDEDEDVEGAATVDTLNEWFASLDEGVSTYPPLSYAEKQWAW